MLPQRGDSMHYFLQFRGLPGQVYVLSVVRFLINLGSCVAAFSALLFSDVLGCSEMVTAVLLFAIAAANALGTAAGGRLADQVGRKKTFVLSCALIFALYAVAGFVATTFWVIPLLIAGLFANGFIFPSLAAMVADVCDEANKYESFSLLFMAQNLGYAMGPAIGGLLFYAHLPWVFWFQALVFAASAAVLWFAVKEIYVPAASGEISGPERTDLLNGIKAVRKNTWSLLRETPPIYVFILGMVLLTMCYQMVSYILPLQLSADFGPRAASEYTGLIWTVNAGTVVLATPIILRYAKRGNQLKNTAVAAVLYTIGFGSYIWVRSVPLYFAAVIVWTTGEILITTGAGAFIARYSPVTHIARFQGLYEIARSTGRAFGPPVFGLLLYVLTYRQAWTVAAAACIIAGVVMYRTYRKIFLQGEPAHEQS